MLPCAGSVHAPGDPPHSNGRASMIPIATLSVRIPTALRDCCGGASQITASASDVAGLLEQIERDHPALYRSVCNETGAVRQHINVFVNNDSVRYGAGLATPLSAGGGCTHLT